MTTSKKVLEKVSAPWLPPCNLLPFKMTNNYKILPPSFNNFWDSSSSRWDQIKYPFKKEGSKLWLCLSVIAVFACVSFVCLFFMHYALCNQLQRKFYTFHFFEWFCTIIISSIIINYIDSKPTNSAIHCLLYLSRPYSSESSNAHSLGKIIAKQTCKKH